MTRSMPRERFPVLKQWWNLPHLERQQMEAACPADVPWAMLAPHEARALGVHDQSLARLAERGGLAPSEMLAILDGSGYAGAVAWGKREAEAIEELKRRVAAFESAQPITDRNAGQLAIDMFNAAHGSGYVAIEQHPEPHRSRWIALGRAILAKQAGAQP